VNAESLPAMHAHQRVAVLLYQDITKQKGIESDLRRANQAKDALLAMLGHELRNPLAAITGAAELIELLDPNDANFDEARSVLQSHVYQMARLVDDILDVSRLNRGKIRIRREPLDVRDVLAGCVQTCRSAIDARRHALTVDAGDEALMVEGDFARLEQVFVNLLSNSAKYTDDGGQISIVADQTEAQVNVRIRDSGIGIDREMLPVIFELFRQLTPTLYRAEGGLGIGLNVVKNLVELHGGSVDVSSDGTGTGSEFVVRLPRLNRPVVPRLTGVNPSPQSPPAAAFKVLVVEDNADIAHSMLALIRHLGHTVELASDGDAAFSLAKQFLPDVAIVDIGLPGMTGLELAQAFRSQDALRSTYLIALTGFGQAEDRRRSKDAGFDEHLVKPLNFGRLQELLAGVAQRRMAVPD
jgi:CheY-like chemotaxis protein